MGLPYFEGGKKTVGSMTVWNDGFPEREHMVSPMGKELNVKVSFAVNDFV